MTTANALLICWFRCLVEIYTALTQNVPIVAVRVAGAFPYDFEDAQQFLANFESELESRNPGASDVVRQAGIDVAEMGKLLQERVPCIISRTYEPYASANVLDAQLEDIISAMESSVSVEGLELREIIQARESGEPML